MIKLTKLVEPNVLMQNAERWTTNYMSLHQNGNNIPDSLSGNYRKTEIKDQLLKETFGKCAYCESKVSHVYPGDVEHITPKSLFPDKVFEWENMTYACYMCNNLKRDYHSMTAPLINPYIQEPSEYLRAYGSTIFALDGSVEGEVTVSKLDLNRASLVEKRTERLESLNHLIARWHSESDPDRKKVLLEQIKIEAEEDKEYSFMVKQYILDRCRVAL